MKPILTAALVIAVAGSALALKAKPYGGVYYCRADNTTGTCPTASHYSIDTQGSTKKCNSGVDTDTNCNTSRTVSVDGR